jgi:hypothetical protein
VEISSINNNIHECVVEYILREDERYSIERQNYGDYFETTIAKMPLRVIERMYPVIQSAVYQQEQTMLSNHLVNYEKIANNCSSKFTCPEFAKRSEDHIYCSYSGSDIHAQQ